MEAGQAQRSFHRSHILTQKRQMPGFSAPGRYPVISAIPGLPTSPNAAESLGRAVAVCPARLFLLGYTFEGPAGLGGWICNSPAAKNVVLGRERRQWRWKE